MSTFAPAMGTRGPFVPAEPVAGFTRPELALWRTSALGFEGPARLIVSPPRTVKSGRVA